jgi:hypothetical protein
MSNKGISSISSKQKLKYASRHANYKGRIGGLTRACTPLLGDPGGTNDL